MLLRRLIHAQKQVVVQVVSLCLFHGHGPLKLHTPTTRYVCNACDTLLKAMSTWCFEQPIPRVVIDVVTGTQTTMSVIMEVRKDEIALFLAPVAVPVGFAHTPVFLLICPIYKIMTNLIAKVHFFGMHA